MQKVDTVIIGAGAAGMFCASVAGQRGRQVVVLDHSNKVGKKILMSGGGRCNFTNYHVSPERFLSNNPNFCKSALSRYTPWDFIALVEAYKIPYHEKTLGQLFCDHKAKDIVNCLLKECEKGRVQIKLHTQVTKVERKLDGFIVQSSQGNYHCQTLVIASGGLSIPTMGASPFGYQIAEQFGHHIQPTRAGLVPFTLHEHDKARFAELAGLSCAATVSTAQQQFSENILFTHRGLSGPAILQISSYWQPGETVTIDLLPQQDLETVLSKRDKTVKNQLAQVLPKRLVQTLLPASLQDCFIKSLTHKQVTQLEQCLKHFSITPNATEGYRTAEVTLGGVDCDALSSKTMMSREIPGLFFIGEVVDVTGWLGGYNFQWAWASAHAAGQVV